MNDIGLVLQSLVSSFWKIDYPANILLIALYGFVWGRYVLAKVVPHSTPWQVFWVSLLFPSIAEVLMSSVWAWRGYEGPSLYLFIIWLPIWFTVALFVGVGVWTIRREALSHLKKVQK